MKDTILNKRQAFADSATATDSFGKLIRRTYTKKEILSDSWMERQRCVYMDIIEEKKSDLREAGFLSEKAKA